MLPPRLVLPGLLSLLALAGCWVDGAPPGGDPPICNNNGRCDEAEAYTSCPADCKAYRCAARRLATNGPVRDPNAALGRPDGMYADIAPGASLELYLENLVDDQPEADFSIQGVAGSVSGRAVQAFDHDSGSWALMGQWSTTNNQFDLSLQGVTRTDRIRIEGGTGTSRLDALVVIHCQD